MQNAYSHQPEQSTDSNSIIDKLTQQYQNWRNTPYALGGHTHKGVDCSSFVQHTFSDFFGIHLPRTTREQVTQGKPIDRKNIRAGDLVFFKTGHGPNGYHVGIYVKDGQFLHASTSRGVSYASLTNPYWQKVYWQARRL